MRMCSSDFAKRTKRLKVYIFPNVFRELMKHYQTRLLEQHIIHSFPRKDYIFFLFIKFFVWPILIQYFYSLNEYEGRAEVMTFLCTERFYLFTQAHQWHENMWIFRSTQSYRFFSFRSSFKTLVLKVLALRHDFQINTKACSIGVLSAGEIPWASIT